MAEPEAPTPTKPTLKSLEQRVCGLENLVGKVWKWGVGLLASFSLLTAGGVVTFLSHMAQQVREAERSFDQRLQAGVDRALRDDNLHQTMLKNVTRELRRELAVDQYDTMTGELLRVQNELRDLAREKAVYTDPWELDLTRILVYEVDDIIRNHAPSSKQDAPSLERQRALRFLLNGIIHAAQNRNEEAEEWYRNAMNTDPTLVEPYYLLGGALASKVVLQRDGKWNNDSFRDEAIRAYESLAEFLRELPPDEAKSARNRPPVAEALARLTFLNGNRKKAIEELEHAQRLADLQTHKSPVLLNRLTFYCFAASADAFKRSDFKTADKYRNKAIEYGNRARIIDPEVITGLNNLVWTLSHKSDDVSLLIPDGTGLDILKEVVRQLEEHPWATGWPMFADTAMEANWVLYRAKPSEIQFRRAAQDQAKKCLAAADRRWGGGRERGKEA
jgi:tetratricopeptide (TPR) repeat protein